MTYKPTVTLTRKLVNYISLLKGMKYNFLDCGAQIIVVVVVRFYFWKNTN